MAAPVLAPSRPPPTARWPGSYGSVHAETPIANPSANALITADGGGSNGSRVRLWKRELQNLANQLGLDIVVSHLPPGTSKWNKLEH
jgi:hypothetical protein